MFVGASAVLVSARPGCQSAIPAKLMAAGYLPVSPERARGLQGHGIMSRMVRSLAAAAVAAIAVGIPSIASAQAHMPGKVRVTAKTAAIIRWLEPQDEVLMFVEEGVTLEVVDFDREKHFYWVVTPPDVHGSRKVGWIRAIAVEPAVASMAQPAPPVEAPQVEMPPQPSVPPPPVASAASEDRVSLTVREEPAAATAAETTAARKSFTFDDVHFDRDGFAIRSEDADKLRAAAAALKEDASLVVTLEGHTCNLGTGPYNLALGNRRANAVKEFLVSAGVPAERLLAVSKGEAGAEFDNTTEETRRLNRRVALVPKIPR